MRVGDILEWAAAVCVVYAAYLWSGRATALGAGALCLAYLAQGYADRPLAFGWALRGARRASRWRPFKKAGE